METVDNQIDEIIRECKIYRFASELQFTKDDIRKNDIKDILNTLQRSSNNEDSARDKLNKIYDNIDKTALLKKWTKLTLSQKQDRIKDFVKRTYKNDKNETEKKLLDMLNNGKLKMGWVDYNNKEGYIIAINIEKKPKKVKKSHSSHSDNSDTDSDSN